MFYEAWIGARSSKYQALIVESRSSSRRLIFSICTTNADAFRIYEGQQMTGNRIWGAVTGVGTMKGHEAAIELHGNYECRWSDYSTLPGNRGQFRLLTITIGGRQPNPPVRLPAPGELAPPQPLPPLETEHQAEYASPSPAKVTDSSVANIRAQSREGPPIGQKYSMSELDAEFRHFERQLRAASLKETSITTYVDRTGRFLKWLRVTSTRRIPTNSQRSN